MSPEHRRRLFRVNPPTAYHWQSHPLRYGLHEAGEQASSVRWNFPPLRPYGVTRER